MKQHLVRHALLYAVLVVGLTLRVLVWLAYQPAMLYIDSFRYLDNLGPLSPVQLNPVGYDLILNVLFVFGGLSFISAVQHLVGIGIAVVLYLLALRLRVPRWLAAVVAAVVLLDGYQLQIEQNIMSEIWFQATLVGILWVLIGRGVPTWRRTAVAGLLLGFAILTRTIGVVVIAPVAAYLIVAGGFWRTRIGWLKILHRGTACAAVVAVVVVGYAGYFRSFTGEWGLSSAGSNVLFGRAATIAECDQLPLDAELAAICPTEPVGERLGVDHYAHSFLPPGDRMPELAVEFGWIVLRNQPLDFAAAVWGDFIKNFALVKTRSPNDVPIDRWQFQLDYPRFPLANGVDLADGAAMKYGGTPPTVNPALAGFLRGYQLSFGYTPGPLLAVASVAGLVAALGLGRARSSGLRSAALLATGSGLILLLGSAAFEFSWRYELPALVLLPIGGAIGLTAIFGRRDRLAEFPDSVDAAATKDFWEHYPIAKQTKFGSLVVLIAAYNEEAGIGSVLKSIPATCPTPTGEELRVSVLVVVDGATDNTAAVAAGHGAYVCAVPKNRGQGAALRLGYHLAAEGGAEYIATTDADGQYDNRELPMLMRPLLDGTADFVTGSRRLGSEEADSRVRWLGVRVFAGLASVLTRQRISDTSFGFRAMRADRVTQVTLREPQYQASELLLGMLAGGARLRELPMSMRFRNNGRSKKGRNLVYGANYARVMLGTWVREYPLRVFRRKRTD